MRRGLPWRASIRGPTPRGSCFVTKPARFRLADLDRAVKVAKVHGYQVEVDGSVIRLLPTGAAQPVPSAPNQPDEDWDKALGLK